jgi:putative ABC transport system ATP-binding protein
MIQKKGTTIIMVTHSMHDAGFAHRIINLFDGEVITENVNERMAEVL